MSNKGFKFSYMRAARFEPTRPGGAILGTSDRIIGANIVMPHPFDLENPSHEDLSIPNPSLAELKDPRVSVGEVIEVLGDERGRKAIRAAVYHFAERGVEVTEPKVEAALIFYGRNKQAFPKMNSDASRRRSQLG
jgi:hypothetical protein